MRAISILSLALVVLQTACASVQAPRSKSPRVTLGYTDKKFFAVKHADAVPSGTASRHRLFSSGGWITGNVCGLEINFDVRYTPHELSLNGFLNIDPVDTAQHLSAWTFVRDRVKRGVSRREIFGVAGAQRSLTSQNPPGFDFWMNPERLEGRVGRRRYWLRAEDDNYVGVVELWRNGPRVKFVVHGRSALWSMPAADQAALLPFMLSCTYRYRARAGEPILAVNFANLEQKDQDEIDEIFAR